MSHVSWVSSGIKLLLHPRCRCFCTASWTKALHPKSMSRTLLYSSHVKRTYAVSSCHFFLNLDCCKYCCTCTVIHGNPGFRRTRWEWMCRIAVRCPRRRFALMLSSIGCPRQLLIIQPGAVCCFQGYWRSILPAKGSICYLLLHAVGVGVDGVGVAEGGCEPCFQGLASLPFKV